MSGTPRTLARRHRLLIACLAGGMTEAQGAVSLRLTRESYTSLRAEVSRHYRRRGEKITNSIDVVRAAERDGIIVAPQRIAA